MGQGSLLNTNRAPSALLGTLYASSPSLSSPHRAVISLPGESPGRCPDLPKQRSMSYKAGEVGRARFTKVLENTLSGGSWEPWQVLDRMGEGTEEEGTEG